MNVLKTALIKHSLIMLIMYVLIVFQIVSHVPRQILAQIVLVPIISTVQVKPVLNVLLFAQLAQVLTLANPVLEAIISTTHSAMTPVRLDPSPQIAKHANHVRSIVYLVLHLLLVTLV